jgi:hypothetical protein
MNKNIKDSVSYVDKRMTWGDRRIIYAGDIEYPKRQAEKWAAKAQQRQKFKRVSNFKQLDACMYR